jgi:hypothetical protein
MPNEHGRSLRDSLLRKLNRGNEKPSDPQGSQAAQPPQAEPERAVPPEPLGALRALSLQELLRYTQVLAAAGDNVADLLDCQAEVDRRLVEAEQLADIRSLTDALRRLKRRGLLLGTGYEEPDRVLRRRRRNGPPDDDDWGSINICMCSILPPPDKEPQSPGK